MQRLKQELASCAPNGQGLCEGYFERPYLGDGQNYISVFIDKVKKGLPLEYITNKSYFYKSEFYINESVLIPRSETEILVEFAVAEVNKKTKLDKKMISILDVGTGSGAIILSILKDVNAPANGLASDISKGALEVARQNYFNLAYTIDCKATLNFIISDRLSQIEGTFDVIVSNPPYIKRKKDSANVHRQVDKFEPSLALYLDDANYNSWFESFFREVHTALELNGIFIMEGHENHLQDLSVIAKKLKFTDIIVKKDYNQRDRFLILRKK